MGDSSAPSRKHSAQPRSVSACVATATITHVSGIATTSLRVGSRHAFCSISASTSSPSRNRITISATIARSWTNPERGSISSTSRPPSPSRKPASTNAAVSDRNERLTRPEASAPPISSVPRTSVATSKSATATRVTCNKVPDEEGLRRRAHHRAGQVPRLAGRRRRLLGLSRRRRRPGRAARLRARRVRQAAALRRLRGRRRGRDQPPARRPHPRPGAVRVRPALRAAPAAGPGRRQPRHRPSGAAAPVRPAGRAGGVLGALGGGRDDRRSHRAGVRRDGL